MKKFELYVGIALIFLTTCMLFIIMLSVTYTINRLGFMCFISTCGYTIAYLYIDSYLCNVEKHYYSKGFDDATAHRKEWDSNYSKWYDEYTNWLEYQNNH
jgi:hypothetical protein